MGLGTSLAYLCVHDLVECRLNVATQSVCILVVCLQEVTAKHALRIDPHRVDVVGAVLGVVVLDQRRGPMNAKIMRTAGAGLPAQAK